MKSEEVKTKAQATMDGPTDLTRLWKLMEDSNAGTMQLKLFQQKGDEQPFRAIVLISGRREVKEVLELLDSRDKE